MRKISAKNFDAKFDAGEDISDFVDWSKMTRPGRETRRVNVDFPAWVVEALDREARRLGVTRQALVKLWIAERLGKAA
jgi:CopG antitoxin of type II toxin-antitoxin system